MSKKQAILDTTLDIVTEQGLYDTPMAQISQRASVAAGTIYHYFENKEKLILELYLNARQKMGDALLEKNDPEATYQRQFVQFWKNLYNFFINNPKIFMLLEQFDNSPFYNKLTEEDKVKYLYPLIQFLENGINDRTLKPLPVELVVSMLHGSIAAVAKNVINDTIEMDNAKLMKAIQISWDGLKLKTVTTD